METALGRGTFDRMVDAAYGHPASKQNRVLYYPMFKPGPRDFDSTALTSTFKDHPCLLSFVIVSVRTWLLFVPGIIYE